MTETIPEEAQTRDLLDKELKSTILNMLKEVKIILDKELNKPGKCLNKMRPPIKRQTF